MLCERRPAIGKRFFFYRVGAFWEPQVFGDEKCGVPLSPAFQAFIKHFVFPTYNFGLRMIAFRLLVSVGGYSSMACASVGVHPVIISHRIQRQ